MSTTRKRKVLSLKQKLEVCILVERGELLRKIAESFGVSLFTVSDIYRSRCQLTDFVSHMDTSTSSGCLTNFKSRHGIRELEIHG
ncbi:Jerky protein [Trichinella sp. T9]|uniref:Jerky protein n=1 Tax=Trichinella murrelli TaxID=144512 RepID=A0A0V0UDL0_9BILA|nr:Jerky protein [Trichinella murrelli]KRX64643.1 Jerky protein [Trichinella sp. T9]